MFFLGLSLLQHGHQVKYLFLQWASRFVTYMAVMTSHGNNINTCVPTSTSFSKPTENIRVVCSPTTMPTTTRKLRPHLTRLVSYWHLTFQPVLHRKSQKGTGLYHCSSLKLNMIQQNARTRKASTQPAKTSKAFIWNNKNKGWIYASTGTTTALVTPHHATTNMNASSASQKRTLSWIVPRGLKGTPSRRRTQLSKKQTITYHSYS